MVVGYVGEQNENHKTTFAYSLSNHVRIFFGYMVIFLFSLVSYFVRAIEGEVEVQYSEFWQESLSDEQPDQFVSLITEWEFFYQSGDGAGTLVFTPFARVDSEEERTEFDIRELLWTHLKGDFEFRAGIGREFWGVTEFHHLVDVINQIDFIDDFGKEARLGQPMLATAYQNGEQRFELWWLPYFRERNFMENGARFQFLPLLNNDDVIFESKSRKRHNDFALRWSTAIGSSDLGNADIGVSYFNGTAREPTFLPIAVDEVLEFVPFYAQSERWSLDAQWVIGNWLWKLETIRNRASQENYVAATGGFEYNFVGVGGSRLDLGVIIEYMYDQRADKASHFFQDDLGLGLRLAFNDEAGSEVLFSYIDDQENGSKLWRIDAERRINSNWSLGAQIFVFSRVGELDILNGLRRDDYLKLTLNRYF